MINRKLARALEKTSGTLSNEKFKDLTFEGVSTDSRKIEEGMLYVPLVGANFDGRDFIPQALESGAGAFLVEKNYEGNFDKDLPFIEVEDNLTALQDLARAYREELNLKVIGITGSNGKTTSKDLVASVLSQKYRVEKTIGNHNNELGLPLTLLDLEEDTEIAVIEMGMDGFGQISLLTSLARPDFAVITNIGDSHLVELKSKENIARAKLEILEGLKAGGTFLYNGDDPILRKVTQEFSLPQSTLTFGEGEENDYSFKRLPDTDNFPSFTLENETYTVPLLGDFQAYNGALAVIFGRFFGLTPDQIRAGLMQVPQPENRSQLLKFDGFDILNDSYKSNPQSLAEGLKTAAGLKGYERKILCLSDMLELGEEEVLLHEKSGAAIDSKAFDYCLFTGDLSHHMYEKALENFGPERAFYFEDKKDLIEYLKTLLIPKTLIFIKGSRATKMEDIIGGVKDLKI